MKIRKAELPTQDVSRGQLEDMIYWRNHAANLLHHAALAGVVITIENPPNEPLAIGNYDLVISARPLRNYKG